jgi:uncharacterized small protein (DUF1192 family)
MSNLKAEFELLSVRELVERLAAELAHAADMADHCQAMSADVFVNAEPTEEMFERAQDLDLITQRMRAIGKVLHNLAIDTNEDWEVERVRMLSGVGLTELTERIGQGAHALSAAAPKRSSEIELF